MQKEMRVKLYRTEDDNYNELWAVIDNNFGSKVKYICRHVYYKHETWCYVSDPLGYCELDYQIEYEITVIVCDKKGNELFRSSNNDVERFKTLEETAKEEWNKIANQYPHVTEDTERNFYAEAIHGKTSLDYAKWLLTFKDPEIYEKEADDYAENWIYFRAEKIKDEVIHKFQYLGQKYGIHKVTYKHKICGVEWVEYASGIVKMGEYDGFIKIHASYYDVNNVGTMYPKGIAIDLVCKALEEIYSLEKYDTLSKYLDNYDYKREQKLKIYQVAESLLRKDNRICLNRNFVNEVIIFERNNPSFFKGINEIRAIYGNDVQCDYK